MPKFLCIKERVNISYKKRKWLKKPFWSALSNKKCTLQVPSLSLSMHWVSSKCLFGVVARSEPCPLCMQAAPSLIPMFSTLLRGDWSWKNFYGHSPSSADSRRAVVSYWQKSVHQVLVNCLGGLPRINVIRLTDHARNDLKCVDGP